MSECPIQISQENNAGQKKLAKELRLHDEKSARVILLTFQRIHSFLVRGELR